MKEVDRLLVGAVRGPDGRDPLVVAGLVVMDVVRRRAGVWSIPAKWADVLDRWRAGHVALLARARRCGGCGAMASRAQQYEWRSSGADGWITQCPACAGGEHLLYGGSMRGVLYSGERRRATRADGYLCAVCGLRQAVVWDHCHEPSHGYVRGPVCASCNQAERSWHGIWRAFWDNGPAVRHLLECNGCRTSTTLPLRHLSALAAARLRATARHGRCAGEPSAVLERLSEGGSSPGWNASPTPSAGRRASVCTGSRSGSRTWRPSTPDRRSGISAEGHRIRSAAAAGWCRPWR
ncbi:endonuclease domain-containing protein [Kitasatospora sp. NPDC059827]|uniref:endonuclease domain-containing protein n=1 Tax=Kitasatospora sp. NPDC059827 TaxID=3346964 RepID=UPI003660D691